MTGTSTGVQVTGQIWPVPRAHRGESLACCLSELFQCLGQDRVGLAAAIILELLF